MKRGGEMAHQLRALAAILQDLGSVPNNHRVAHNHLQLQFQQIKHSLLTPVSSCMRGVLRSSLRLNTYTYIDISIISEYNSQTAKDLYVFDKDVHIRCLEKIPIVQ